MPTCRTCGELVDPARMELCPRCNTPLHLPPPPPWNAGHLAPPPRRSPARLILALALGCAAVLAAIAVTMVVTGTGFAGTHDGPTHAVLPAATSVVEPASTPAEADATADPGGQAAAIDGVITEGGTARANLNDALGRLQRCDGTDSDVLEIQSIAATRNRQYDDATQLTVDALPNGVTLRGLLAASFDVSRQADDQYASWAADQVLDCVTPAGGAAWGAAQRLSGTAVQDKTQFVNAWNPVAERYGLPDRSETDL